MKDNSNNNSNKNNNFIEELKNHIISKSSQQNTPPIMSGVDYGYLKQVIAQIEPNGIKDYDDDESLTPQDVVDMSYDATLQELMFSIDCKVYDESHITAINNGIISQFLQKTIDTAVLQSKNILLTSSFWMDVVKSPKTNQSLGYFQRVVDSDNLRINYSELSARNVGKNLIKDPVLTTIQFDFEQNADGTIDIERIATKEAELYDKLFSKASEDTDVGAIYNTAALAKDFSIHKYYLPDGVSNIDNATLLIRYDHCSLKHKNGSMPKLYKEVYPEYVDEPHFHFNSGFGGLYKLDSKSQVHNYGVGYAIGVTGLTNYLTKLYNNVYKDENERKLYTENDFGMPFLSILNTEGPDRIGELISHLEILQLAIELQSDSLEITTAYNFTNIISNTEEKNLDLKYHDFLGSSGDDSSSNDGESEM